MVRVTVPAAALLAALLLSAPAPAQGPVWVQTIDGSAPGTPAEIELVTQDSTPDLTLFDVTIHGFWQWNVVGGDGKHYQRLDFPGLQPVGQTGAPEVPAVRATIVLATDADEVFFDGVDEQVVQTFPGVRVYPLPLPGMDEQFDPTEDPGPGDTVGTPEVFSIDPAVYGVPAYWPSLSAMAYPPDPIHGAFEAATCVVFPVTYHPGTRTLRVVARSTWTFSHPGFTPPKLTIGKDTATFAKASFVNWEAVKHDGWDLSFLSFHSRYAILARADYDDVLHPFVQHKKSLGFEVTVLHVEPNETLAFMKARVRDWYQEGDPAADHFLLVVGDTDQVPLGTWIWPETGAAIQTDDHFGSPIDGDLGKEIHVGRLSIDGEGDLANQLQKILDYELSPAPGGRYDRALLVAHKEEAPEKYEGAHEDVRTAFYTHPPVFVTKYGSGLGPTDLQVSTEIQAGTGVVAYRGHGSTNSWAGWNAFDESYHKNDVIGLANVVLPVVWAVTCTNGNIDEMPGGFIDSIAETWMEHSSGGGVASYGATRGTSTKPNHELDRRLFEAVYRAGLTVHGQAIAYAEMHVDNAWPDHMNPWAYLLLGDPSMRIRRDVPEPMSVTIGGGGVVTPCEDQGCVKQVPFTVKHATGEGIAGALVVLHKASLDPSQPDEVQVSAYTNGGGQVSLPVSLGAPGPMTWTVQDGEGNVSKGVIDVPMGSAWADLGGGQPGTKGPLKLVGVGTLAGGTFVTSILTNALENSVATLVVGLSPINAPFKGGLWIPDPLLLVPGIPTGPHGVINLPVTWPVNLPSGISFYEQYWMADPGAPLGFAGSNAIRGTTP